MSSLLLKYSEGGLIVFHFFDRFFEVLTNPPKLLDVFGPVRTVSDAFGHVWMHTDAFGCVWPIWENFDFV